MPETRARQRIGARPSAAARRGTNAAPPEVAREAMAFAASLRAASGQWGGALRRGMRHNPYAALGAAAGAGYVLAGGLAPAAVRVAFAAGWRVLAAALLREFLASVDAAPQDAGD